MLVKNRSYSLQVNCLIVAAFWTLLRLAGAVGRTDICLRTELLKKLRLKQKVAASDSSNFAFGSIGNAF